MSERSGFDGDEEADEIAPGDPDYDLSEGHGYLWYPERREWPVPRWVLAVVSVVIVVALVLPTIIFILRAT